MPFYAKFKNIIHCVWSGLVFKICLNISLQVVCNRQAKITDFVKKAYHDYFRVKVGDQDKPFVLHVCCKTCEELDELEEW